MFKSGAKKMMKTLILFRGNLADHGIVNNCFFFSLFLYTQIPFLHFLFPPRLVCYSTPRRLFVYPDSLYTLLRSFYLATIPSTLSLRIIPLLLRVRLLSTRPSYLNFNQKTFAELERVTRAQNT